MFRFVPVPFDANRRSRACRSVVLLAAAFVLGQSALARPPATVQERTVDLLALVGGERLLGMFVAPPADGKVQMLVRREWLRQHAPDRFRETTHGEADRRRGALEQLKTRLIAWRERRSEPKLLTTFLDRSLDETEQELKALSDEKNAPEPAPLLLVSVPVQQVRKNYQQPPEHRRLLGLAWEAEIDDAEELTASALREQLKAKNVDVERAKPDLSDRIETLPLDDRQWAAKMALAEYAILGKPHFQGAGSALVREDSGQDRPALGELVAQMAQSQLADVLGELLGPGQNAAARGQQQTRHAIDKATRGAEADNLIGVRLTLLDQDMARHRVTVTDRFLAKMPDDGWQPVWEFASSIDASQPRAGAEKKLEDDPQIAEAIKLVKGLGLPIDDKQLQTAMQHGVATQQALEDVDTEFAAFLLAHTRQLAGPPLFLPPRRPAAASLPPQR